MQRRWLFSLLSGWFLLALAACSSGAAPAEPIPAQTHALLPGQTVRVEVYAGALEIRGTDEPELTLAGSHAAGRPVEIQAETGDQGQLVLSAAGRSAANLEITVPQGISLTVQTFSAAVSLFDLEGSLFIDSTSGDIHAEGLRGDVTLRSGRGDVLARRSSGSLRVLGEHGVLTLEDSHGTLGSATIMGTIQYLGAPVEGDSIRLEVDHGPVQVDLTGQPDLTFTVQTTSGDVVCPPGLPASSRSCQGELGSGAGRLTVRTVSGKITVRLRP